MHFHGRLAVVVLYFFLTLTHISTSQTWQINNVASGTRPSLKLDSQGNPNVAYIYEIPTGWLRYAVWNPTTLVFDTSTVNTGNFAGPPSIALDQNDVLGINYHRHTPPPEQLFATFDGSTWTNTAITSDNHDGWDNSLAYDSNNLPHTSTVDPVDIGGAASTGVEYASFDGTSWQVEAIGSAQIVWSNGTSLELDANNDPHITYYDSNTGDLMYAVKTGGTWTITTIDATGDVGRYSSLELDSAGNPRVSYYQHLIDSTGYVKYASWNGSSWDISVVDTVDRVYLTGARTTTSLAIDAIAIPHLSYGDEKVLKYATFDGSAWQRETIVDFSGSAMLLGQDNSIDLGSSDIHIAYYERLTLSPLTGIVKHATRPLVVEGPCDDFTNFLARCTGSGMVQARVVLRDNLEHSGETVLFDIDETIYPATIGDNGTSSRASISISGLGAGDHTVTLIDPADCFNPIVVTCLVAKESANQEWEADDARWAAELNRTEPSVTPAATRLLGNYPNPFNPSTTIRYALSEDARISVRVYNMLGQEVVTLFDGFQKAGDQSATWNGTNKEGETVASGLYIYRIQADNMVLTDKVLFLK